jgi:hypothetical protein
MARFPYNNDVPEYKVSRVHLGGDIISGMKLLHQDYGLRAAWATYRTNYGVQVRDKYLQHLPSASILLAGGASHFRNVRRSVILSGK